MMTIRIISLVLSCLALAINLFITLPITIKTEIEYKKRQKELKNFYFGEHNDEK